MPELKSLIKLRCSIAAVALVYGGAHLVFKSAMTDGASPFVFVFYRAAGGTAVMLLAMALIPGLRGGPSQQDQSPNLYAEISRSLANDGFHFLVLGVLTTMNIGGFILAVSRVSAITTSLFQPSVPIIAACLSVIMGMERLSLIKLCSVIASVGGALIVIRYGEPESGSHSETMLGMFFLSINVIGSAAYTVYQKRSGVLDKYAPTLVASMSFMIASGFCFLAALANTGLDANAWKLGGHTSTFLALSYGVFLNTAFNYTVLAWANKRTTPIILTSFNQTVQPIVTATLSAAILGVLLTHGQAIGGLCIIFGLLLNVAAEFADLDVAAMKPLIVK